MSETRLRTIVRLFAVIPALIAAAALAAFVAAALDVNSLRLVKAPADGVSLTWNDPTPGETCVHRGADKTGIPVYNSTSATTFVDTPPTLPVLYYFVEETSGSCMIQCQAAAAVACGDAVSGRNDAAGSTDVIDGYPACSTRGESGPEFIYSFVATGDDLVTLYLTDLSGGLDLYVLRDEGAGCTPESCVAYDPQYLEVPVAAGTTYFFVVDGFQGAVEDFSLTVNCFPLCVAQAEALCSNRVSGANDAPGSTSLVSLYPCSAKVYSGPELAYWFRVSTRRSQEVTVFLSNTTADLDVLRLHDFGAGCVGLGCTQVGDDSLTFTAIPGIEYYFVVDGANGAISGYDLQMSCSLISCPWPEAIQCAGAVTGRNDQLGSTNTMDEYIACASYDESGPEVAYMLTPPSPAAVTINLSSIEDLDLFLLEDRGSGCNPADCVQYGDSEVTFLPTVGVDYYIIVDGFLGAVDDFTLRVLCTPECTPAGSIACGTPVSANNGGAGSADLFDTYAACSPRDESGREMVYEFTATSSASVTAVLSDLRQDLDLFVIRDSGFGCRAENCVAFGDASTTFGVAPGEHSFVVVDGFEGATSDFTLRLNCAPLVCSAAKTISCAQSDTTRNDAPGSTDVMSSYPACWFANNMGPEMVYAFTAQTTEPVTIGLWHTVDLNLVVLEDRGTGCDPNNCIAAAFDEVTLDARAGTRYFLVVDSVRGNVGTYTLGVSCGSCSPAGNLACGGQVSGNNSGAGSTDEVDGYAACVDRYEPGPEVAYTFNPASDLVVTATLSNLTADLDLFVLEDEGTGCAPETCLAWGNTAATFTGRAGHTYFVVVDGYVGATGNFTLSMQCTPTRCTSVGTIACGGTLISTNDAAGSTNYFDSYDSCVGWDESGPEIAWSFTAVDAGSAFAAISYDPSFDLDLFVLREGGTGCDPANCVAYGDLNANWATVPGATYYLVVDGYAGDVADFMLSLQCVRGGCAPAAEIFCGDAFTGNTANTGSSDVINTYPAACSTATYGDREFVYSFMAFNDTEATVTLVPRTNNLDLFVLQDGGIGCDRATCFAYGGNTVTFPALASASYYIVVDGSSGTGAYDIALTCDP